MIDFDARAEYPTAAAVERLLAWTEPVRSEHGLDVALPDRNGAQRQRALIAEGVPMREVFAETVRETRETYAANVSATMSEQEPRQPTDEELAAAYEAQLKQIRVEDVLIQTLVSLLNLGGRKAGLEPAGPRASAILDQVRQAIEGVRALLPRRRAAAGPRRGPDPRGAQPAAARLHADRGRRGAGRRSARRGARGRAGGHRSGRSPQAASGCPASNRSAFPSY